MKYFKHVLVFLVILIAVLAGFYLYYKQKFGQVVSTPLPTITEVTSQPTSTSNFSLENAPTESLKGNIPVMTGEVDWQDRVATEAAKISSPSAIQQGEKLITGEKSTLSLVFPSAVSVKFLEKTAIEMIQTLPANLVFSQTTGMAEYTKTGGYPVSVRTLNLLTNITGDTIISINPDKPIITLTVKSGDVTVAYNDLKYLSHEVTITAGHTYTFNSGTRKAALK